MNEFAFSKEAFSQYLFWQTQDRKTLKKINDLLEDVQRNGAMKGTGKPERLNYRKGFSRRIDDSNRLVYDIDELGNIRVISCKGHYDE